MSTKLCNKGGATCDEGTDLGLAFSTSSVAHAKCQLGEHKNNHLIQEIKYEIMHLLCYVFSELTCFGITYDPLTEMWSLKTSEDQEMASKHISYEKACVESKTVGGSGMYNEQSMKIV